MAELAWARSPAEPLTPPPGPRAYPLTPPRVYRGKHLEAVAMPLGGIGTGSIWLDGQGRLAVWQIFNNLSEPRIPDSLFAVLRPDCRADRRPRVANGGREVA